MKYSLNDIFIVPSPVSVINSRSECNPFYQDGSLPLFTAPMSSVVDMTNYNLFKSNNINPILPRTIDFDTRMILSNKVWAAFSLDEFITIANNPIITYSDKRYLVIDIANGHMLKLHNAIMKAKEIHGDNIVIMAGNIANPETYAILSDAGADYVRLGIGLGSCCITASNTAIYYPIGSLIEECFNISMNLKSPAKIIADGGVKGFSDIIKCLALGADYVMCGSIFNRMLESAGVTYNCDSKVNQYDSHIRDLFKSGEVFYKEHYGMSTKKAQMEISGKADKTSEGIKREQKVEYTMGQWVENFVDYFKSAMSYASMYELNEFIGNVNTIKVTNNSYNAINK